MSPVGVNNPFPQINRLERPGAEGLAGRTISRGGEVDFTGLVTEGVKGVNRTVTEFESLSARFAGGERVNLHELMVKGEQADMSLRLLLSVRNKVVEAYQEIMRLTV